MNLHAIILSPIHIWSSLMHCLKSIQKKADLEISAEEIHINTNSGDLGVISTAEICVLN